MYAKDYNDASDKQLYLHKTTQLESAIEKTKGGLIHVVMDMKIPEDIYRQFFIETHVYSNEEGKYIFDATRMKINSIMSKDGLARKVEEIHRGDSTDKKVKSGDVLYVMEDGKEVLLSEEVEEILHPPKTLLLSEVKSSEEAVELVQNNVIPAVVAADISEADYKKYFQKTHVLSEADGKYYYEASEGDKISSLLTRENEVKEVAVVTYPAPNTAVYITKEGEEYSLEEVQKNVAEKTSGMVN